MTYVVERPGRSGADAVVAAMSDWEPLRGFGGQMHSGDVGWYLRYDDAVVDAGLHVWRTADGELVAVGLQHGAQVLLTAVHPARLRDMELGEVMAQDALKALSGDDLYIDAPYPAAVRVVLAARGWDLDPDPWPALYRPVTESDLAENDAAVRSVLSDAEVEQRVEVQQRMFERSESTVAGWHRMRQTAAYSADLDLMLCEGGHAVAAATAWSAGVDKCGLLEPVGVHVDHRGKGYGSHVVRAACAALARAGASGVAVFTSASNEPAVALYKSCGFRTVGLVGSPQGRPSVLQR